MRSVSGWGGGTRTTIIITPVTTTTQTAIATTMVHRYPARASDLAVVGLRTPKRGRLRSELEGCVRGYTRGGLATRGDHRQVHLLEIRE